MPTARIWRMAKEFHKIASKKLLEAGIDWLTLGNHAFIKKGAIEILEDKKLPVLRPANWAPEIPGRGLRKLISGQKKFY